MEQITMTYGAEVAGAADWSDQLAWLRKAVDVIGHKEVAYRLDIAPSQLTDSLLERERKDVKAKWVSVIVRLAPPEMRDEWVRINTESFGYEMPKRRRVMTPDDELVEMRRILKEQAPAILEIVEQKLGKKERAR